MIHPLERLIALTVCAVFIFIFLASQVHGALIGG